MCPIVPEEWHHVAAVYCALCVMMVLSILADGDETSSEGESNSTSAEYTSPSHLKDPYDIDPAYFAWDDLDDLEMSSRSADEIDEVFNTKEVIISIYMHVPNIMKNRHVITDVHRENMFCQISSFVNSYLFS